MARGIIHSRLKRLEERTPPSLQPGPTDARRDFARERMKAHLDRLASLRRGELSEEEAVQVEILNAAVERRMRERAGGVGQ